MKKIAIMCDSGADISLKEAEELGFHVIRMPININGVEYKEAIDITREELIQHMRNGDKVNTSQPIMGELVSMWDNLLKENDQVFYLPIAKALSGTCQNAINLSKEDKYAGKVFVVDSEFVSCPSTHILTVVKDMFDKGYSCEEVKEKLENETNLYAILIPENLDALKAGGRISPAVAALAGLLKIVPLLTVDHGAIDVYSKVRTLKKAYQEGINAITKDVNPEEYDWMVIDADNKEASRILRGELEQTTGMPVAECEFKSIVMSHVGPGTIGFGRIKKLKY